MNSYQKLVQEYEGFYNLIKKYTSDPTIINYFKKLKEGLDKGNYDEIMYNLAAIDRWYDNNISKILANHFEFHSDSHLENAKKIKEFKYQITKEDCCVTSQKGSKENKEKEIETPIIFISHKSDDKKYGDAIRGYFIGLGVDNSQIIYTSHPLNKVPLDSNIYDFLRQHIRSGVFVIFLWSNEYLDSPACLNEMGAAWVTQVDYSNIFTPDFCFDNPKFCECAVDTKRMGIVLNGNQNCKAGLIELRQKIQKMFGLENDEQKSSYLLDELIKAISEGK